MKKFKLLAVLAILFSIAILPSCGDDGDACEGIVCMNDGICENGACACEAGYEGSLCETLSRAKLLGSYTTELTCDDGTTETSTATVTLDGSNDIGATISISGSSFLVVMTGRNSFNIPEQQACGTCTLVEYGSGTVESEGVLEMEVVYSTGLICNYVLTPA